MRFVKPESLDKDSIILDVRGADEYAHERLALPHIVIKADKVDPDKFMAEYNPGGDKLVNILCTSGGKASNNSRTAARKRSAPARRSPKKKRTGNRTILTLLLVVLVLGLLLRALHMGVL